jgi:SAM-dependent methyltransferase
MADEFNVNEYWLERGRKYIDEQHTPPEFHRLQEQFLLDVLQRSGLPMRRVLEIGCGFGRITRLLAETWPDASITALDLSPEQLANARRHCDGAQIRFEQYDFYSGQAVPGQDYDSILAIEVFLHHPPAVVLGLLRKLAEGGRHIVNIDWSEDWRWPTPEHVWVHDFARLYDDAGLKCAVFPLPEKINGKQQKLFIAGRALPETVTRLERERRPDSASPGQNSEEDWASRLHVATIQLMHLIPNGDSFILVDDAQWGNVRALSGYRVIPFLEKDGVYWGPPADDGVAWTELERLRAAGASHIAFAWPSYWWLRHYAEFHQRLRDVFRCVMANERLIVFKLHP